MLFEDYQKRLNTYIVRSSVSKGTEQIYQSKYIGNAVDYFNSIDTIQQVKDFLKKRFGQVVSNNPHPGSEESIKAPPSYRRVEVYDAIDMGLIEAISVNLGPRIAQVLACLFSPKSSRWTYTSNSEKYTTEEVDTLISNLRDRGNFRTALVSADYISTSLGTGILRIDFQSGELNYHSVKPNDIIIQFGETLKDNENIRYVNQSNIEDALAICIRVSSKDDYEYWVAYVGRNEDFPNGRMVSYKVSSQADPRIIPPVGYPETHDYTIDGNVCNPLTYAQNIRPELVSTEYPIVFIDGGYSQCTSDLLNITTTLYETSIEYEVAISRLLKEAESAALGIKALKNPENQPIPESIGEGSVVLNAGQEISVHHLGGQIQSVSLTLKSIAANICQGWSVPPRLIIGAEGIQPTAASALFYEHQPLIENRERRVELNKDSVSRIWPIEKGLLFFHENIDLSGVSSMWNPGDFYLPMSDLDKLEAIDKRRTLGLSDSIQDCKDFYEFVSEEDAINHLEKMKSRANKFSIAKAPILPERAPRKF